MFATLPRAAVLAAALAAGGATGALAQEAAPDPHHPEGTATETVPAEPGAAADPAQAAPPAPSGMMGPGPMGGMMGGMMGGAGPEPGMPRPVMRVLFAVTDADGDGGLTFEEVSALHKRVFDAADADRDGKLTAEELHGFLRG